MGRHSPIRRMTRANPDFKLRNKRPNRSAVVLFQEWFTKLIEKINKGGHGEFLK